MAVIHCCNFERAFCVLLSLLLRTLPSSNLQAFSKHVISLPASFSLKTLLLPCIVKQRCQFQVVVTSALKKMDPLHEIDSTALKLSNMSCRTSQQSWNACRWLKRLISAICRSRQVTCMTPFRVYESIVQILFERCRHPCRKMFSRQKSRCLQ